LTAVLDGSQLVLDGSTGVPIQANRASYVPYFYSRDGYAALGHSNVTHFNRMAARWGAVIPLMGMGFCRVSDNQLAQLDSSPLAHHRLGTARHGRYHSTGQQLAWAFEGAFQLYLMPAASLSQGASEEPLPLGKASYKRRRPKWLKLTGAFDAGNFRE
jgi:hypothetical protein